MTDALEKQMRAERGKRAAIAESEGRRQSKIEVAEGPRKNAESIQLPGGGDAVNLRVAQQYVKEFGNLAIENNTVIIPSNPSDIGSLVAAVTSLVKPRNRRQKA